LPVPTGAVLVSSSMRNRALPIALALAPLALGACVHRKMIVRSTPSDAIVVLDGRRLEQRTPFETEFHWDGVRRLTLMAPDHEVLDTTVELEERWYDWFPLDFFAEFLYPGGIEDVQTFDYELAPYARPGARTAQQTADLALREAALRSRADRYRAGGSDGPLAPGAVLPTPDPAVPPKDPQERDRPRFDDEGERAGKPGPKKDGDEPKFDRDETPPPPPK